MTITVALKPCCGALPGDVCECAEQAVEVRAALMTGLVDRARAGDKEAFGQVWEHHRLGVFKYVLRQVGQWQLAEDITSEVSVRALTNVAGFTWQGRAFGAWLTTIARNLVADHFKSAGTRRSASVDPIDFTGEADRESANHGRPLPHLIQPDTDRRRDPEQVAEHNEISTVLDRVITLLSGDQRRVLALRFGEGLSVAETAAVMGKHPGAIKALQYRATQSLAAQLRENSLLSERY